MQKMLLTLLCISSFAYAETYEKIEKAVIESNLEATRTFLDSELSQREYSQLIDLANSMIEKRKIDYNNNHRRPFLSGGKIALAYGVIELYAFTNGFFRSSTSLSILHKDPTALMASLIMSAGFYAGTICLAAKLIQSFLSQGTEKETLYNNAIMIKHELDVKMKDLQEEES